MRWLVIFLILLTSACIDPIDLKVSSTSSSLVVDGWITDQPGPYLIKISRSVPYNGSSQLKVYTIPERGAKISITDDLGKIENLTETTTAGTYTTSTLTGAIGRSYQLKVVTTGGKTYHSTVEELKSVPDIQSVSAKFQVSEILFTNANGSARVAKRENFGLYVTINDPPNTKNFYRWEATGIFEFFSVIDLSAFKQCWAPTPGRLESRIQVAGDLYFDGQTYTQLVGLIPYDRTTFYLVTLKQFSLTEGGYNFLKRVSDQQTSTGTLFDPPPTEIPGNITNDNDSNEVIVGYFSASSVKQTNLLVDRWNQSGKVTPTAVINPRPGDCRTQEPFATNVKPPGF